VTSVDSARAVRAGEELDLAAVAEYLKSAVGVEGPVAVQQFPSGASNLTYLVTIGDRAMVLRRPPFGRKPRSGHDMGREVRVLTALKEAYPYVPAVLAHCEDPEILGDEFYVMERIEGIILRKALPKGLKLSCEEIGLLCRNVVDRLVELHSVDFRAAGLGDLGRPEGYVRRQIEGWSERFVKARTPNVPPFDRVMEWLAAEIPPDGQPCLIHGDFRFDNVVLDPQDPLEVVGVLDWEMATIGDGLMDLGNSLAYWVEKRDPWLLRIMRVQPTSIPGMMTRDEVVTYYADKRGLHIASFDFYRIYGVFRLVVIMQQIYYRYFHRQTRNRRFGRFRYLIKFLDGYLNRLIDASSR